MTGRPIVVVLGPTASGKSDVAMAAATSVAGTEIVAVDAMQVYRRMDIGTAKPTATDRAAVTHHCLDLVDPAEPFTVADYRRAHDAALGAAAGPVLLVAGTGLYLTVALDRLELPGEWPEVRAELEATAATDDGVVVLAGRLRHLDPRAATRIEPGNVRRILRALEVTIGSGRPFSAYGPGVTAHPPTDATLIGLRWPRPALTERVGRRVEQMMTAGLLDEVRGLPSLSRTARQALGYKELLDHLDGRMSLDAAVEAIVTRTRQFAVRQERWFRRDPRVRWFEIGRDPVAEVAPAVVDALA